MEEKKTKSTGKTVAIVILSILLITAVGYIGYDKVLKKEITTKKENNINTNSQSKTEKTLNINNTLVKELYYKVVGRDGMAKYSMYKEDGSFDIKTADEKQKMLLVHNVLDDKRTENYECDKIPSTINLDNTEYKNICEFNKETGGNYSTMGYKKDYIEFLYNDLFGNGDTFDSTIDIEEDNFSVYHYVEAIGLYVKYMHVGGGEGAETYSGEITKAVSKNDEIYIYEKVNKSSAFDADENYTAIYKFKLTSDGNYSFISRTKES